MAIEIVSDPIKNGKMSIVILVLSWFSLESPLAIDITEAEMTPLQTQKSKQKKEETYSETVNNAKRNEKQLP